MYGKKYTILVADDYAANLVIIKEFLGNDYNILTVTDGQQVIKATKEIRPDLILMDLMMPIKDGLQTCKELQADESTRSIPVIILTAKNDKESLNEGLSAGAVDFITKPFNKEELHLRIKNHLRLVASQKRLTQELEQRIEIQKKFEQDALILKIINDNITDAIVLLSPDATIKYASPSCEKIYGIIPESCTGKKIFDLAETPEGKERLHKFFNYLNNECFNEIKFILYNKILKKNVFLSSRSSRIISGNGYNGYVIDTCDITPTAQAVMRLRGNVNIQRNMRYMSTEINNKNVGQAISMVVETLFEESGAREVFFMCGKGDSNHEIFIINVKTKHLLRFDINGYSKPDQQFAALLISKKSEGIFSSESMTVPEKLKNRYRYYLIFPISQGNKLLGFMYIGDNRRGKLDHEVLYQTGAAVSLLRGYIYRKINEYKFLEQEIETKNIFDYSAYGIIVFDSDMTISKYNKRFLEMMSITDIDVINRKFSDLTCNQALKELNLLLEKATDFDKVLTGEINIENLSGKNLIYEVSINTIFLGNGKPVRLAMITDVTDIRDTERSIYSAITKTEERERTRMARELHDGMGALLSSINIYLNLVLSQELEPKEIYGTLELTRAILAEAIQTTKELANNLHPVILTRFGLIETIEQYIKSINKAGFIKINFIHDNFPILKNKDKELSIYRILNELINNTLKYAQAKNILIEFGISGNKIIITYADDGKGFDISAPIIKKDGSGMGLSNINGRIKTLEGTCFFETKPEKGMKVLIKIPYIA